MSHCNKDVYSRRYERNNLKAIEPNDVNDIQPGEWQSVNSSQQWRRQEFLVGGALGGHKKILQGHCEKLPKMDKLREPQISSSFWVPKNPKYVFVYYRVFSNNFGVTIRALMAPTK